MPVLVTHFQGHRFETMLRSIYPCWVWVDFPPVQTGTWWHSVHWQTTARTHRQSSYGTCARVRRREASTVRVRQHGLSSSEWWSEGEEVLYPYYVTYLCLMWPVGRQSQTTWPVLKGMAMRGRGSALPLSWTLLHPICEWMSNKMAYLEVCVVRKGMLLPYKLFVSGMWGWYWNSMAYF